MNDAEVLDYELEIRDYLRRVVFLTRRVAELEAEIGRLLDEGAPR